MTIISFIPASCNCRISLSISTSPLRTNNPFGKTLESGKHRLDSPAAIMIALSTLYGSSCCSIWAEAFPDLYVEYISSNSALFINVKALSI